MKSERINKMVRMAVLSALGIVLAYLVRFPLLVSYLEYDMGDVPILIGTFMYGPVSGIILALVVSAVQALTFSAASSWVGFIMHFIATGTLVTVAGLIYSFKHTRKGAILALLCGSLAMTAVMIPLNLIFTPLFNEFVTVKDVISLLMPVIVPFNLIKAGVNSLIVALIYKPLSKFLRCNLYIGKTRDPKCDL